MESARRRRSKAWLHFTKENDEAAKCTTVISCKGGRTTNMIKHLQSHGVDLTEGPVFDALRPLPRLPLPAARTLSRPPCSRGSKATNTTKAANMLNFA